MRHVSAAVDRGQLLACGGASRALCELGVFVSSDGTTPETVRRPATWDGVTDYTSPPARSAVRGYIQRHQIVSLQHARATHRTPSAPVVPELQPAVLLYVADTTVCCSV